MSTDRLAIIVLAAGKGTRMRSRLPKVMHKLAGQSMLRHVLGQAEALEPFSIVVVVAPDMPTVIAEAAPHRVVIQPEQLGTGNAVAVASAALEGQDIDTALVVFGDSPLVTANTLRRAVVERRRNQAAVTLVAMRAEMPNAYGRLVVDAAGNVTEIVETTDATPVQREITLCNSGIMAIGGEALPSLVGGLSNDNAKHEYYLTEVVALARRAGHLTRYIEAPIEDMIGINSRAEQAVAEAVLQRRLRDRAMADGATLIDPDTVYFSADTKIGQDVVIGPGVFFGPGVTVEDNVEIRAYCHIEGAIVRSGALIGPFARLRPGADIGHDAHVGNFVEIKNAVLAEGAKANHLSYIGDATIGARTNIGAGTITCNYDGFSKFTTAIGADVFIGSNTALVAPVSVGDRAMVAAGSVVTRDVAADAMAIARGQQVDKPGFAAQFRVLKAKKE